MIRTLLAAALALLSSPALPTTISITDGLMTVHQGDTLVTSKPLVEDLAADKVTLTQRYTVGWINRMDGHAFSLSGGATKLKALGPVNGGYVLNGYTYQVVDGTPVVVAAAASVLAPQVAPRATPVMFGVNIGDGAVASQTQPGTFGYNWAMPSHGDVDTAYAAGVRMFRLPLLAERMQNGFDGPLRPEAANDVYPVINYILSKPGAIVLIDWHDFGNRKGVPYGTGAWNSAAIADLNAKFLAPYKAANVWIDLQNEPGSPPGYWQTQQAVITSLRGQGFANPIVVEGTGFAAAYDWAAGSPKDVGFRFLTDPLGKLYASAHVYPDSDDSGTHAPCLAGSETRLDPVIAAATAGGYKLVIGEIGFSADASCAAVRSAYIAKLKGSPAIAAVTFWGYFSWLPYPNYLYGLRNGNGTPSALFSSLLADWKS